jgi:hypothetical protein
MVDVPTISIVVASASVVAGVIYYFLQIQHQKKMRQTDLVMRLYDRFSSNEFQDAWAKARKRGREYEIIDDMDEVEEKVGGFREFNQVSLFFEGVGILLKRKIVDKAMIEDLFGGAVERAWENLKAGIIKGRKQYGDPTIYYYFEYLYDEMKKEEQQPASKTV